MGEGCSLASGSQATVRSALQPFIVWPFHPHNPQLPPQQLAPSPNIPRLCPSPQPCSGHLPRLTLSDPS